MTTGLFQILLDPQSTCLKHIDILSKKLLLDHGHVIAFALCKVIGRDSYRWFEGLSEPHLPEVSHKLVTTRAFEMAHPPGCPRPPLAISEVSSDKNGTHLRPSS